MQDNHRYRQGMLLNMNHTKETMLQKPMVVAILALVCCLLWGSAFPCIKIGYKLFAIASDDSVSQLVFAGTRFTLAGVLVILFGSLIGRKVLRPQTDNWGRILILALFQTILQYVFFYMGLAHTTGVKSSIIEAANVFIAILFSVLLFRFEKLTTGKVVGCIVGFAGVVLINLTGSGMDVSFSLKGEGAILASTIAYALSAGLIKLFSRKEDPVVLSGYQFFIGGLVMTAIGVLMGGRMTVTEPTALLLLLYMAFISAVAYTIWGILLKYNPVARVSVYGFMNPVFGVILSAFLLGEKNQAFGLQGVAALVLVCIGIYVVNREPKGNCHTKVV